MIEVRGVQPTAREIRPLQKGWGGVHWWACLPLLIPFVGLWALALVAADAPDADGSLLRTTGIIVIATTVAWVAARYLHGMALLRATRSAPGGGSPCDWIVDGQGLEFRTGVSFARVDWAGIKGVREEKDRVVFLLTPASNPVLPKRQLTEPQLIALRQLVADVTAENRLGGGVD